MSMGSCHSNPDLLTDIIRLCKVVEINYSGSFKDAKQVFDEIAGDHGYEPETANKSGMIFKYSDGQKIDM
jgi:hypothetical protein